MNVVAFTETRRQEMGYNPKNLAAFLNKPSTM
jgi:hypothetical protein